MTQINTPYPSTTYLTSYLQSKGYEVAQKDLGLDLVLRIFSREGLERIKSHLNGHHESIDFFLEAFEDYKNSIGPVIRFLQGKDSTLALRIANRNLVPEGPRFLPVNEYPHILERFGEMGLQDRAKYIASLYLDDISDVIKHGIDSQFEFSRYGELLAASQTSFTPLYEKLGQKTIIDDWICEIMEEYIEKEKPNVVGFTVPFPGNMLGALRASKFCRERGIKTVMGGGYINTELRELSDSRVFEFVDYITFDDGERPLECLLEFLSERRKQSDLLRTLFPKDGKIQNISSSNEKDPHFENLPTPTYEGLSLKNYVSMLELPNPLHRMWSDFRWNKLILAHGCYWKKCTFCDVNLDYIGRFEPAKVDKVIQHIESITTETQNTGFHFVDEAAPPSLLKKMSEELVRKKITVNWWGNIRFDSQFTSETTHLMADAGCVAVTGGLEVASPRLLKLINKGVTIEQVARVTKNFSDAGIYVHAYLMYGFPTQTTQETIDSLEVVRQLFENECIQSAHWHRFICTTHSPVGRDPEKFGIELVDMKLPLEGLFARNEIPFHDPTPCDHTELGKGLRKALYNYMHNVGIDGDVRSWFEMSVPKTTLPKNYIRQFLMDDLKRPKTST